MQVLDLYYRSYGNQRNSFHLRTMQVAQKTSLNIFLLKKEKCAILEKSIPTMEALVYSIPISNLV
jgi:hypothetical protein